MNRLILLLLALFPAWTGALCDDYHSRDLPLCTDVPAPATCKVIYKVTPGADTFNNAYQMLLTRTDGGVIEVPYADYRNGDRLTLGYNDEPDSFHRPLTIRGIRDPITGDRPKIRGTRATGGTTAFGFGGRLYQGIFWNTNCVPPATMDMSGECMAQNTEPRAQRTYVIEDIEVTADSQGPFPVTAISNASQAVVTVAPGYAWQAGDVIQLASGWPNANGRFLTVQSVAGNQLTTLLNTANTTTYPPGAGVGTVKHMMVWRQSVILGAFKKFVMKNFRVSYGLRSGVTNSAPGGDHKMTMELCNSQFDHNGDGANTGHNLYVHGVADYYEGGLNDNYSILRFHNNTCYAAAQSHCLKTTMNYSIVTDSLFRQGVQTDVEANAADTEWEGTEMLDIVASSSSVVRGNTFSQYASRWRNSTNQTMSYYLARGDVCGSNTPHICDMIPSPIYSTPNPEPAWLGTAPDYVSPYFARYAAEGIDYTLPNPSAALNKYLYRHFVSDNTYIELNPAAAVSGSGTTYANWAVTTYPTLRWPDTGIAIYHDMDETEWECLNGLGVRVSGPYRNYDQAVAACAAAGLTLNAFQTTHYGGPVPSNWFERSAVWFANNTYRGYMRQGADRAVVTRWNRGLGPFAPPTNPKDVGAAITFVCGENTPTPCELPAWFKTDFDK